MSLVHVIAAGKLDLPFSVRRVLIALADMADSKGNCAPTIARLEDATGIGMVGVYDALDVLIKRKLIVGTRDRWKTGASEENDWTTYQLDLGNRA